MLTSESRRGRNYRDDLPLAIVHSIPSVPCPVSLADALNPNEGMSALDTASNGCGECKTDIDSTLRRTAAAWQDFFRQTQTFIPDPTARLFEGRNFAGWVVSPTSSNGGTDPGPPRADKKNA